MIIHVLFGFNKWYILWHIIFVHS